MEHDISGAAMNRSDGSRESRPRRTAQASDPTPVTGLMRGLVDDVTQLFSKELQLARTEIARSVDRAKSGMVSIAVGGAVLFAGLLVLLAAAVLGIGLYVQLWISALIVGVIVALIGFAMLKAGQSRIDSEAFVPRRTIESIQKDQSMVREKVSS